MITILIVAASLALLYVVIKQIIGTNKVEKSIDVAETLLPKEDIHAEIAKVAEEFKAQAAAKIPVVEKSKETKSKKSASPKKEITAKKPATPKMKASSKKNK